MAKKEKEKVNSTFTPGKSTRPESVHWGHRSRQHRAVFPFRTIEIEVKLECSLFAISWRWLPPIACRILLTWYKMWRFMCFSALRCFFYCPQTALPVSSSVWVEFVFPPFVPDVIFHCCSYHSTSLQPVFQCDVCAMYLWSEGVQFHCILTWLIDWYIQSMIFPPR